MGYTPKHAKATSVLNNSTATRRYALFAIHEPSKGRHAALPNARRGSGTATPEFQAA